MSYTIKDVTNVLGVTPKTCFRWIEDGLKIIPESKNPIYIHGSDLKEFHRLKNLKRKVTLGRNEFYCLTCKRAVSAKRGSVEVLSGRKLARCRACNGKISRLF